MNTKDYKAIAKKINPHFTNADNILEDNEHQIIQSVLKVIIINLADYFEKEDIKDIPKEALKHLIRDPPLFNKKQFLKDCGVKK